MVGAITTAGVIVVGGIPMFLGAGVGVLVETGFLPLVSLLVEPGKILFLNNTINHGVFTPLGTQRVAEVGKSIFFLIEANPGPGLGMLPAYSLFGRGAAKQSAPASIIIHFLGGIHEIYFPYVLAKPRLIVAMLAGGMTGVAILAMFGAGLRAPASPGSIFAVLAMTPADSFVGVIASVACAAAVSFVVASALLRMEPAGADEDDELAAAAERMKAMKAESKGRAVPAAARESAPADLSRVRHIVVARDAGMGSSAMGASLLRKKLDAAGLRHIRPSRRPRSPAPLDRKLPRRRLLRSPRRRSRQGGLRIARRSPIPGRVDVLSSSPTTGRIEGPSPYPATGEGAATAPRGTGRTTRNPGTLNKKNLEESMKTHATLAAVFLAGTALAGQADAATRSTSPLSTTAT